MLNGVLPIDAPLGLALPKLPAIPPAIAVIVPIVTLVAVGIVTWWKKRKGKAKPAAAPKVNVSALNRELSAARNEFFAKVPSKVRRSLEQFQPVVLLGTESSGKSSLVERFSGVVQRRAELGSAAQSGQSQARFTIGAEVLAVELSEEVSRAPSDDVEAGLRRIFGPICQRRAPLAVICLSAAGLLKGESELGELGAALRAKLDVLSELRGEPVVCRLVITDTESGSALGPLFRLLELPGVRTTVSLEDTSATGVAHMLREYADEWDRALASLGSKEALAIIGALESVSRPSEGLGAVLTELFRGRGGHTPVSGGIYLLPETGGADPLAIPDAMRKPAPSPLLKHRLFAASLAIAAMAILVGRYRQEASAWADAADIASSYALERNDEANVRATATAYATYGNVVFFREGPARVGCEFVDRIRREVLVPALNDTIATSLARNEDAAPQIIYILALLYAYSGSDIAPVIDQYATEWDWIEANGAKLPESTIRTYLRLASPYYEPGPFDEVKHRLSARQPLPTIFRDLKRMLDATQVAFGTGAPGKAAASAGVNVHTSDMLPAAERFMNLRLADYTYTYLDPILQSRTFQAAFRDDSSFLNAHRHALDLAKQLTVSYDALGELQGQVRDVLAARPKAKTIAAPALASLVRAMRPLLELSDHNVRDTFTFSFDDAPVTFEVQSGPALKALRQAVLDTLLETFRRSLESARQSELALFPADGSDSVPLVTAGWWPTGVNAADHQHYRYTYSYFDQFIKSPINDLGQLSKQLDEQPQVKAELMRILGPLLSRYAGAYADEIDRIYGSLSVAATTTGAMERILEDLGGSSSPFRSFLLDIVHETSLGIDADPTGLLSEMQAVQNKYAPLSEVVKDGKPDDPLVAYQDILRDAAAQIESVVSGGASASSAKPAAASSGDGKGDDASGGSGSAGAKQSKATLSSVERDVRAAVAKWVASVKLNDKLAKPFYAPIDALRNLVKRDLTATIDGYWRDELRPSLDADLLSKFPFSARSSTDATPDEIAEWLHPKQGRLFQQVLPFLEPTFVQRSDAGGRSLFSAADDVQVPAALLTTLGRLVTVSRLLWDDKGNPSDLCARVQPRPFVAKSDQGATPTLVRLSVGDAGVYYFNQQPHEKLLKFKWTEPSTSRVAMQLAKESMQPPLLEKTGPWSFLRLLQSAKQKGSVRSWNIDIDGEKAATVSFNVREDATSAFQRASGSLLGSALCEGEP